MNISEIIAVLEELAPPVYQETYDNCGLLTGNASWQCTGILCTLDATEPIVQEAIDKGCNLIVAHHPIIFGGLKKITGKNYVEQTVIRAIKNDIAIYAIHTNLDNISTGVNRKIADTLGLINQRILSPKSNLLVKLLTFVPVDHTETVRNAIFNAGAGHIGNYSECSFSAEGTGTFKGNDQTIPFVGEQGKRHEEKELKLEVILPAFLQQKVVSALLKSHPYEEVAYDIVPLANEYGQIGSGMIGELPESVSETVFLDKIRQSFDLQVIKHTHLLNKPVKTVALCGGAGSFLINKAKASGADFYITGDIKYHEFFDAESKIVVADIGHWESEQFTPDLIIGVLRTKFPTFAVFKSDVNTNPVHYFLHK